MILGGVGLAALVGGGWFVFGRDDDDDTAPGTGSGPGTTDEVAPQVAFGYDYDSQDNELTITVLSGDAFTAEQVTFRGEGLGAVDGAAWHEVDNVGTDANPESVIGSGDRTRLAGIDSDFQLDIVWISQDGNSSSIISTSSGPDA